MSVNYKRDERRLRDMRRLAGPKPLTDAEIERMLSGLPTTRTCGDCDLCCTALGVEELGKAAGVRCGHLCGEAGRSCAIYPDRPPSCREFVCLWRASDIAVPDYMHPAKVGLVLTITDPRRVPLIVTAFLDPDRPLAWQLYIEPLKKVARDWNGIVAIGEGPNAVALIAPTGAIFRRAEHPELFLGGEVGIPENCFVRPPRPLVQVVSRRRP